MDNQRISSSPCQIPHYLNTIYNHAGTVLLNDILICGGREKGVGGNMTDACNIYNWKTSTWKPPGSMLSHRINFGMVTVGSTAYVVGGLDLRYLKYISKVEAYVHGRWISKQSLPKPLAFACVVALDNNTLMAMGGREGSTVSKSYRNSQRVRLTTKKKN